jgi:hypothetical protein
MNLTNLVKHLLNPKQLEQLYQEQNLNQDSEALLIYMNGELELDSEITIFEMEETDDDLIFEKNGLRYIQFFPVDHAIDLIQFDLNLKDRGYSDTEIAKRLLQYRLTDA